jgi:hypothetical protein
MYPLQQLFWRKKEKEREKNEHNAPRPSLAVPVPRGSQQLGWATEHLGGCEG